MYDFYYFIFKWLEKNYHWSHLSVNFCFFLWFLMMHSISSTNTGILQYSISSLISSGKLYFLRNFSISSTLLNLWHKSIVIISYFLILLIFVLFSFSFLISLGTLSLSLSLLKQGLSSWGVINFNLYKGPAFVLAGFLCCMFLSISIIYSLKFIRISLYFKFNFLLFWSFFIN